MMNTHQTQALNASHARPMRYSDYLVLARRCEVQRVAMTEAINHGDTDLLARALGFAFGLELINSRLNARYNNGSARFAAKLNQLISRCPIIRNPYGSM